MLRSSNSSSSSSDLSCPCNISPAAVFNFVNPLLNNFFIFWLNHKRGREQCLCWMTRVLREILEYKPLASIKCLGSNSKHDYWRIVKLSLINNLRLSSSCWFDWQYGFGCFRCILFSLIIAASMFVQAGITAKEFLRVIQLHLHILSILTSTWLDWNLDTLRILVVHPLYTQ